jgi:hypothetical protein
MADKQKGLPLPEVPMDPMDLYTLEPDKDLIPAASEKNDEEIKGEEVPVAIKEEAEEDKIKEDKPERFKTSVELTPETLDLIGALKREYRRKEKKHLPLWLILDKAVKLYAAQQLRNTEIPNSVFR